MPLRDILHKKDKIHGTNTNIQDEPTIPSTFVSPVPEIRFVSSDTTSNEPINTTTPSPPHGDDDDVDHHNTHHLGPSPPSSTSRKSLNVFRRSSRSPSESSVLPPSSSTTSSPPRARRERSLSQLLHLDRSPSRSPSPVSVNIPADLPQIDDGKGDAQDREAQWEKRATVLVQRNERFGAAGLSPSPSFCSTGGGFGDRVQSRSRSSSRVSIADPDGDVNIQEAIRLHETGELEVSTKMFGKLADPNGANNALSQVLYGLALRHGWGCTKDPEQAISYLSAAASNSASIESQALQAGIKKGGAAKGELVLAIFELANCFRNGWGVARDPVAARQYFETAANLGDTDAMIEVAWCYLEGFGGKKDKCTPPDKTLEQPTQQNIISVGQFTKIHKLNNKTIRKVPLDKSYIYSLQAIEIEGRVYAHLGKHKRIARCIDYNNDFIDLQYEPNGDLQSYLAKNPIGLNARCRFARQAIEAVTFIHSKDVIHSDLSARQFLVDRNGKDIRLSDFGGSSVQGSDAIVMENATHFLPRDENLPNTVLSDLFALGSTLYEIFVGRKPYEGVGDEEVQRLFGERVFPVLDEGEGVVGDERWRRVIWKCWMCEYERADDILGDVSSALAGCLLDDNSEDE